MSLDGNGTYSPPAPQFPAIPNTIIYADDFNQIILDIATALSTAIFRDGQAAFTANQSMGGHKLTDLANGVDPQDAATLWQVFTDPVFVATTAQGFKVTGSMLQALMMTLNLVASGTLTLTGTTLLDMSASGEVRLPANSKVPTAAPGTADTTLASTAFVSQVAMSAALPGQAGNVGGVVTTDGNVASWAPKATGGEMTAGTEVATRALSPALVAQAINALALPYSNNTALAQVQANALLF